MYRCYNMHGMRFIGKFTLFKNRLQQRSVNLLRINVSVLLLFSISLHASAITTEPIVLTDTLHNNDTVSIFAENILFPKSSAVVLRNFNENNIRIDSIFSFLSKTDTQDFLSVKVTGSYSPEGEYTFNTNLADARARALAKFVQEINPDAHPVTSIRHPLKGQKADYRQLRIAELQIVYRNNIVAGNSAIVGAKCLDENNMLVGGDNSAVSETRKGDTIVVTSSSRTEASVATSCISNDYHVAEQSDKPSRSYNGSAFGSRLFVTTNMLYDAALTPNIGIGISATDRITLQADWMYARWSNHDKRRYWRIYGGDFEVRYRIGSHLKGSPLGGHYVGAYGTMACYDFQAGRSHTGILSDKYNCAVGLSYTYSLPIFPRFNIDFNLGAGYLWGTYKKHRPIDDCDVWLSTHKLGWLGPTRIGVTLVWLVGDAVTNNKKGGNR